MTAVETWQPAQSELVVSADPTDNLMSWARAAQAAHELAVPLCRTSFVPAHFKDKPDEATAAILYGAEAGLSPLQALQGVYVISGKPAMYARTLMAVVLAAGHEVWTESESESRVVVCGRRRGSDNTEKAVWTIDRAKKAGYTKNAKYQSDPQSMLLARAQSDVCRRVAPDALLGMAYSVEELQDADEDTAASNGKRTVRRTPPTPPAIEPVAEATDSPEKPTASSRVKPRTTAQALPLLPGEQEPDDVLPARTSEAPLRKVEDVALPPPKDEPEKVADRRPGSITQPQSRMMMALMNQAGLGEREDRLDLCRTLIGRPELSTSTDLTKGEAQKILDHLVSITGGDDDPEPGFDDEEEPPGLPYKDD